MVRISINNYAGRGTGMTIHVVYTLRHDGHVLTYYKQNNHIVRGGDLLTSTKYVHHDLHKNPICVKELFKSMA
jgi:hypothetical protein